MNEVTYSNYEQDVSNRVRDITQEEILSIVTFMYADGWASKDTANHIESVRSYNKRRKESE
jgi:hypothetical protein